MTRRVNSSSNSAAGDKTGILLDGCAKELVRDHLHLLLDAALYKKRVERPSIDSKDKWIVLVSKLSQSCQNVSSMNRRAPHLSNLVSKPSALIITMKRVNLSLKMDKLINYLVILDSMKCHLRKFAMLQSES